MIPCKFLAIFLHSTALMLLSNIVLFLNIIDPLRCSLHQLSSIISIIPSLTLRSKIFSSAFWHNWRYALRFSLQLSTIIDATLWYTFSVSNILPSFCYAQRSSLRHHHWSYSPRSSVQFSTFLPPLMEDMGGIWFATWFWLSGAGVRHDKNILIQPPNLKRNAFPAKLFFF